MKTLLATAGSALALIAVASPAAAQNFRELAQQDLNLAAQELRENHPAMVVDDAASASFRAWMQTGLAETQALTSRVNSGNAYAYALRYFANGFRDSNVSLEPSWDWERKPWDVANWPNFSTAWRNGQYVVSWVKPGVRDLPPLGSTLLQCDGETAEQIAQKRLDKFEGDLTQEPERLRTAPYLLWNRGNPLAGTFPAECEFQDGRRKRKFKMVYVGATDPDREAAYRASAYAPPAVPLVVEQVGNLSWVHLHTLDENNGWQAFYSQLESMADQIRGGGGVVIDMRGADGRSDEAIRRGYQTINRIWSPEFVFGRRAEVGDLTYRVSADNRQWFADAVARMRADEIFAYDYPEVIAEIDGLVAKFDEAMAAGQQTFTAPALARTSTARSVIYNQAMAAAAAAKEEALAAGLDEDAADTAADAAAQAILDAAGNLASDVNPVQGQVIVLVDGGCSNGCLDIVDQLKRLPNTRIAGSATLADTIFIEQTQQRLPSTYGDLSYGHKAWTGRARASNQPIVPELPYTGNPADENAVRTWVAGLFGG